MKKAPFGVLFLRAHFHAPPPIPVGASLLAKATGQLASMLKVQFIVARGFIPAGARSGLDG
jgi:hypothetical protein